MNQSTSNFGEDFERRIQEQIAAEEKTIIISKNEALYLNDSLTLLIAHPTNQQSLSIPVRIGKNSFDLFFCIVPLVCLQVFFFSMLTVLFATSLRTR